MDNKPGDHKNNKLIKQLAQENAELKASLNKLLDEKRHVEENNMLLKIAGEKAQMGGWSVDLKEDRVYWSDEVARIHEVPIGFSPLVSEGISYYAPEWRDRITEVFTRCVNEGIPYDEEMEIITAKGNRVWVRTIGEAVKNQKNKIFKVQGAFQNISKRKQTEQRLKESQDKYQRFFEDDLTGNYHTTLDGRILLCNDSFVKILKYSTKEEMYSLNTKELYFKNNGRKAFLDKLRKEKKLINSELTLKAKDGSKVDVIENVTGIFDDSGKLIEIVGYMSDISEQKKAQEELRKNEKKYRIMFDLNPQPMWIYDLETLEFLEVNKAAIKNYGYSKKEFLSMTLKDIRPADDIPDLLLDIKKTHRELNEAGEWRHLKKNGELIDVEITSHSILFNNRKARHVLINDITARKKAERELRKSEYELNRAQQITHIGNWHLDIATNEVFWSEELYKMYGFDSSVPPPPYTEHMKLFTPESWELLSKSLDHTRKTGVPYELELEMVKINGRKGWMWVRGEAVENEEGKIIGLWGAAQDISERKNAELELQKQTLAIEQSPVSIIITELNGNIIYVNPKAIQITGYSKEELIGQNPRVLKSGETSSDEYRELWQTISSGKVWKGEFHNQKKNGELYWESASISPVFNNKGRIVNYVAVKEDITERKEITEDLKLAKNRAEQNEAQLLESQRVARLGYYIFDINANSWSSSDMLNEIFGIDKTYAKSLENWLCIIHPDFQQEMSEYLMNHVILNKQKFDKEYKIINQKNKAEYWVHGLGNLVFNENGEPIKMVGTIQDITNSKKINEDLVKALKRAEKNEKLQLAQNKEIELNNERLESLLRISQYQTNSIQELLDYALKEAINLTGSKIGYIYFYSETKRQFTLNTWSDEVMAECKVINPQTIYELDKTGFWGEVVRQRKPMMNNDFVKENPLKKGTPAGHVQLKKFLSIPVIIENKIVAVAGVANKKTDYNTADIRQLTLLMDTVWKISERIQLITNLEIAKEKAEKSEEKFRKTIMTNPDAISINRLSDGVYLEVNDGFQKTFEYHKNEIVGKTPFEINIWSNVKQRENYVALLKKDGIVEKLEAKFVTKTGRIIDCLVSSAIVLIDDQPHTINITKDISDLKQIEYGLILAKDKAEENELKYRAFIEQSSEGIYRMELEKPMDISMNIEEQIEFIYEYSYIAECNKQFAQIYGYDSPIDFIGVKQEVLHGGRNNPINRQAIKNFISSYYRLENIETEEETKDGKSIILLNSAIGYLENRKLLRYWGQQLDITEQKQILQELTIAKEKAEESDRLKSAFLASMSHEIRTPMNSILGFTDLLLEPDLTSDEMESYIKVIHRGAHRMLDTVNDIVEISKIEAGAITIVDNKIDIINHVEETVIFFGLEAKKKGLSLNLNVNLHPSRKDIVTDNHKLDSILNNLIKNAIKFTDAGEINVSVIDKDDYLEFCVQDTGIGISREKQNIVFDRFMQADITDTSRYEGSGLGLAITKSYVEMLGGKIWLESEINKGSSFYFTLPYK